MEYLLQQDNVPTVNVDVYNIDVNVYNIDVEVYNIDVNVYNIDVNVYNIDVEVYNRIAGSCCSLVDDQNTMFWDNLITRIYWHNLIG